MGAETPVTRVGIVGSGFIGGTLAKQLRVLEDLDVSCVLTRRDLQECAQTFPQGFTLTNSPQEVVDKSDVIVECSGDAFHATDTIAAALKAKRMVVTMNSEFHVTCGSHFADNPLLTEAEGDQPGSTAALREDVLEMGFRPTVYGNMKGFLNHTPTREDMEFWAKKQNYSVDQTTSFTDGTKMQIEQAFVANAFGGGIAQTELIGVQAEDFQSGALSLATRAAELGFPIADYVMSPGQPAGVFVCAEHDNPEVAQQMAANTKMGSGPYYVFTKNYHMCALEIPKTIRHMLRGGPPLLNNSSVPTIGVAAVAKRALKAGEKIETGIGGFDLRGIAVRFSEYPNHVPIGLTKGAVMRRAVEAGASLELDDIELPDKAATKLALEIIKRQATVS